MIVIRVFIVLFLVALTISKSQKLLRNVEIELQ